jgi:hypothetical protein
MKQFDAPKKKKGDGDDLDEELEDATDLQVALADLEAELEDNSMNEEDDSWEYNMHIEMTDEEVMELEKAVKPVRRVLTKVF